MSTVSNVTPTRRTATQDCEGPPQTRAAAVLPAAMQGSAGLTDNVSALLSLACRRRDTKMANAETQVAANHEREQQEFQEMQRALEHARKEVESGGLFEWLSEDTSIVGFAALVTCNWPVYAADLAVHKSGLIENEAKVDVFDAGVYLVAGPGGLAASYVIRNHGDELVAPLVAELERGSLAPSGSTARLRAGGDVLRQNPLGKGRVEITDRDVKPLVKDVIMVEMIAAGAVAAPFTGGSTLVVTAAIVAAALSTAAYFVERTQAFGDDSGKVAMGLSIGGAVVGVTSGVAGALAKQSATVAAKQAAERGARIAKGVTSGAQASMQSADTVIRAHHGARALDLSADAEEIGASIRRSQRITNQLLEGAREDSKTYERIKNSAVESCMTEAQTLVTLATVKA